MLAACLHPHVSLCCRLGLPRLRLSTTFACLATMMLVVAGPRQHHGKQSGCAAQHRHCRHAPAALSAACCGPLYAIYPGWLLPWLELTSLPAVTAVLVMLMCCRRISKLPCINASTAAFTLAWHSCVDRLQSSSGSHDELHRDISSASGPQRTVFIPPKPTCLTQLNQH